jgi:hypothetical protein
MSTEPVPTEQLLADFADLERLRAMLMQAQSRPSLDGMFSALLVTVERLTYILGRQIDDSLRHRGWTGP